MVSFFRDRWASSIFWLIILSLIVHAYFLVTPPQVHISQNKGLLSFLLQPLTNLPTIANGIIYHLLVLVTALRINYVCNDLKMFPKQAFTTAMCYVMLTALFKEWNHITEPLIINLIIIWLFNKTARLYNNPHPKKLIYNIGFIVGLVVLLYYPTAGLLMACLLALVMLRPFYLNEWFILLLGILTPVYFITVVLFLTDNLQYIKAYLPVIYFDKLTTTQSFILLLNYGLLMLLIAGGMLIWQQQAGKMLIQSRKNWGVLLLFLITLIPSIFIAANNYIEVSSLILVPITAFASSLFLVPRKAIFPSILFWLIIIIIAYNHWFTEFLAF